MSKELTALEKLMNGRCNTCFSEVCETERNGACPNFKNYKIIETALKNYQELLKRPCVLVGRTNGHTQAMIDKICKNYKEIKITNLDDEKKLKALEIIKEIIPIEEEDFFYDKETDTYFFIGYKVSKKQFDLLKEVML